MNLNKLYAQYADDPVNGEADLLTAITARARQVLRDDDEAQEFVIGVWQELPIPVNSSFAGWLNRRLLWHKLDAGRRASKRKEIPASKISMPCDDDGNDLTNDEKLDILRFRVDSKSGAEPRTVTLTVINDPVIRKAAELMLLGYSQKEVAERLGMNYETLKKKLQRFVPEHLAGSS